MKLPAIMAGKYRETQYGWEPVQDWSLTPEQPDPQAEAERIIHGLVMETVACGVPLNRAVKWWDYILRREAHP